MNEGKLIGIATRAKSHAPMLEHEEIEITIDSGCEGDARGRANGRQVSVLAREAWDAACSDLGQSLPWTARRANLLVEGLELADSTSSKLRIGDVVLEVACETDPCARMTEAARGLREALEPSWRGGVCCRVLAGGRIRVGSTVTHQKADDA